MSLYPPIRDYALVGDCHGAALVSRAGSIDWCTFGRFDDAPMFCAILDARRGGSFHIRPAADFTVERAYLPATNVLQTTFRTASGTIRLTDFMPVGRVPGSSLHDYVTLRSPTALVRVVEGISGTVGVSVQYDPTIDYGRHRPLLTAMESGVAGSDGSQLRSSLAYQVGDRGATTEIDVRAGDRHELLVYPPRARDPRASVGELLETTVAFWREWTDYIRYEGPHRDAVVRSALALKAMTYAPTGALVASPTTSLPEAIGAGRNWDYRYCWLRDSALTLYALASLGYSGEASRFGEYLLLACHASYPRLQIMYGIDGEPELPERTLDHLEGYEASRPVRIGNGAHDQTQHDVIGEVLDWAHIQRVLGSRLGENTRSFLAELADRAAAEWHKPDSGLWEMRGEPRHYVYSKVMSWVALDRACRLTGSRTKKANWRRAADEIVRVVHSDGVDRKRGTLMQAFGKPDLDAALLTIPFTGFPLAPDVYESTVDAIIEDLGDGPFVYRYRCPDGMQGKEGAFLICSFWLADALLWLGRKQEAKQRFDALLRAANDVGLFAEEIDAASGSFLGNFPQAFTHLALIHTATLFELEDRHGLDAVRADNATRARRLVGATAGPMALWNAFRQSGRIGRFRSSKASQALWASRAVASP